MGRLANAQTTPAAYCASISPACEVLNLEGVGGSINGQNNVLMIVKYCRSGALFFAPVLGTVGGSVAQFGVLSPGNTWYFANDGNGYATTAFTNSGLCTNLP